MRRLSATVPAGIAAALALALTVPLAPAGAEPLGGEDGVRYTRSAVTIPAGTGEPTDARGEATCPKGWEAVGGGHTIAAGPGRGIATGMKLDHRRWFARAWQVDSVATQLTTYGVCLRTDRVVEEDATEWELQEGQHAKTLSGSCPGGRVVSGGVTYFGAEPSDFTLNSSWPVDDGSDADLVPDDGWSGRVHYTGHGEESVSVYLVCIVGAHPAYTKHWVDVPPGTTVRTRAFCPPGRPVLGGGVRVNGAAGATHVVSSRPLDSKDPGAVPDDGWLGAVTNTSPDDVRLTVHAVCR
jgi:hypothetical protein